jgi:hypothetical protein
MKAEKRHTCKFCNAPVIWMKDEWGLNELVNAKGFDKHICLIDKPKGLKFVSAKVSPSKTENKFVEKEVQVNLQNDDTKKLLENKGKGLEERLTSLEDRFERLIEYLIKQKEDKDE